MRRAIGFDCEGARLIGTLDQAPGSTGLLIVSGGSEIRSGAWAGQALLGAALAEAGHPVLRFDRRGVGDSEGENAGFRASHSDIAAALTAFRREAPQVARVVGFGNCDAASALALFGHELALDALILANPWTVDDEAGGALPPPAALRRRYRERLFSPDAWRRVFRGEVSIRGVAKDVRAARRPVRPSRLAVEMKTALARFAGPVAVLLATRDRTAELFAAAWGEDDPRIARIAGNSHSFADDASQVWLRARLLAALADVTPPPAAP